MNQEEGDLRDLLSRLKHEHRDLDAAIAGLTTTNSGESFQLQRLKRRKLLIKDQIAQIEDQLLPDIIA